MFNYKTVGYTLKHIVYFTSGYDAAFKRYFCFKHTTINCSQIAAEHRLNYQLPLFSSLCTFVKLTGQEQGSPSKTLSQQLDKHDFSAVVCAVRVGVILFLTDGFSACRTLNQHVDDSLACVGRAVSVFISCTHNAE